METSTWRSRFFILLVLGRLSLAAPDTCPRASAADLIVGPLLDESSALNDPLLLVDPVGAIEGDEVALQRALNLVHKNRDEYVAMLFYASWCPFSKLSRQNLNILSSLFPTIGHFAFEESAIRPSILSRYGVHGFPTLLLLNSTMRVRYHGSRTTDSLVAFYNDVTGLKSSSVGPLSVKKFVDPSGLPKPTDEIEPESCPFSWASSPEKLFQQDTYLALATSFVLIRLLYLLLPQLSACVTRAWSRQIRYTSLFGLWDNFQAYLERAKQGFNRLNPCKRSNLQERAMNAKSWASKSLASVSIGEPRAGRPHSTS